VFVFITSLSTRRSLENVYSTGSGGIASVSQGLPMSRDAREFADEAGRQPNAMQAGFRSAEAKTDFNYQGLPARFEIPEGERHGTFGQEMLGES
jgi:hypothetical protein